MRLAQNQGELQQDSKRIHWLDRGDITPGKTRIVGVMRLFWTNDDIARQRERVGRGKG